MTEVTKETVEVPEPVVIPEAKAPSREDLKAKGWSAKELESAEKRGMIQAPEEKTKTEPKPEEKPEAKAPEKTEEPVKEEKKPDVKGTIPDFTFKTPEQEKAFLDAFGSGTPQRAMYFRMKNERQARQQAESERDRASLETQLLRDRVAALEGKTLQPEVDENGNAIDPEDKPLTLKQLRELQKKEAEAYEKQQQETTERAKRVNEAQVVQEEYARTIYSDFDDTVKRAADVMQNLDALVPEKWKQAKAIKLIRELQTTAANADKIGADEYNAALIAYEIGQLHPEYGKSNGSKADEDGNSKDPKEKANGGLTPEQMKRMEENTQRRASSASIPGGGGRRIISVEDITVKDVLKMSPSQREAFRKKNPEKMAQLLRG